MAEKDTMYEEVETEEETMELEKEVHDAELADD